MPLTQIIQKVQIKQLCLNVILILQRTDIHGQRYQVDLEIEGIQPGQQEIVRTGLIVEQNTNVARLVTLYVRKRK